MHGRPALTRREQEILTLIAQGKRNQQIADALGIARYTVETHLKNIFRKLRVQSRTEAAQRYWRMMTESSIASHP
jgi:DNA-binding CsgD family transcriptional regulator